MRVSAGAWNGKARKDERPTSSASRSARPVERVINGDALLLLPSFAYAEPVRSDWEAPLYARFKEALAPGMTVLDVGASFGLFSVAAARAVGRSGRVFAFEPGQQTAAALRLHLEWNGVADRVQVIEAAAAERSGDDVFWEQEASFVASLLELAAREEPTAAEPRSVATVALDDFCARRGVEPDVVKVDVEGSEAAVLRGARHLLRRRKAVFFLEVHHDLLEKAAAPANDVFRELEEAGWAWEEVSGERSTRHYVCAPA